MRGALLSNATAFAPVQRSPRKVLFTGCSAAGAARLGPPVGAADFLEYSFTGCCQLPAGLQHTTLCSVLLQLSL